jgi:Xaa-Pro aminopeptidase
MIELTNYKNRRDELRKLLGDCVGIVTASPARTKSYDTEHSYRPSSELKYLTGFEEPEAILVLCPHHPELSEVLFVRPKDPFLEQWSGERLGPQKSQALLGLEAVYSIEEFEERLPGLIDGHAMIAMDLMNTPLKQEQILKAMRSSYSQKKKRTVRPEGLVHISSMIGTLRLRKDANEILFMKKAQEVTDRAHRAAMAFTQPGVNESQIKAILHYHFNFHPASGEAYESIIAGGPRACTLHYVMNNQALKESDYLLIDAGSDFHLYASDVTRTFPVNGKFSGRAKDAYEIVLQSQKDALAESRPGKTLEGLHLTATKTLIKGLIDLKILQGSVDELYEQGAHKPFYPHSTGHWIGLDVHDPCPYLDSKLKPITFEPGMAYTIEPGLYFDPHDTKIPADLRGLGIRIEDDILITDKSYENLSISIPKEIAEIEEAMKVDYREFMK